MKKVTVLALAFVLALSVVPVMAASHTGTIIVMHYNPDVRGRGVCVRTNPVGPSTGWFCLYNNNTLSEDINALLREAYIFGRSCTLEWDTSDQNGALVLTRVGCQ
jgi:hypothetical protein